MKDSTDCESHVLDISGFVEDLEHLFSVAASHVKDPFSGMSESSYDLPSWLDLAMVVNVTSPPVTKLRAKATREHHSQNYLFWLRISSFFRFMHLLSLISGLRTRIVIPRLLKRDPLGNLFRFERISYSTCLCQLCS